MKVDLICCTDLTGSLESRYDHVNQPSQMLILKGNSIPTL